MLLVPAFEIGIWNAWLFMIWSWIAMLAIRLVSKEVCQRASAFSSEMKTNRTYRIISYTSMLTELVALIYSIFLPLKVGTMWFVVGIVIFILGLIIMTIASINFAMTPIKEPITSGMYRYSRHPLYLASLLIYLSVGIASASWIFILFLIVMLISISIAVTDEERYCLERYGDSYMEYMNRTPRWMGISKS